MDNSVDPSTTSWSTPRPAGIAMAVAALILLVAAVLASSDPTGMVLLGAAAVMLGGFASYALLIHPRLAVTTTPEPQLRIRTLGGVHTYGIDQVERISVRSLRRIGRKTGQIEFDLLPEGTVTIEGVRNDDAKLVVFSRWDLGEDLRVVADTLRRAGFFVDDLR